MPSESKRILLLYTDPYYITKQIYPFGLDLIAGHLRKYGHAVSLDYPFLPDSDPEANLARAINGSRPDLIGLGLRNLDTTLSCEPHGDYVGPGYRTFFFLPQIERLVDSIRSSAPHIPIIIGGGAFSVAPQAVLRRLGLRYGIAGEGQEPLRRFIDAWPDEGKISKVPNLIYRNGEGFSVNPRLAFGFEKMSPPPQRERKFNYAYETAGLPVQVKRGCNRNCSYCVEPLIEGRRFVFRDPAAVIEELTCLAEHYPQVRTIFFVDTEFNIPDLDYPSGLIKKIIAAGLHERFFFSSQFLPHPFEPEFAELLAEAGFSIILTCDSFADSVLEKNHAPYRRENIVETLALCAQYGLDCSINLIFGLPGETHATIDQTLDSIGRYPAHARRSYECTYGARIYRGTPLCRLIEKMEDRRHLFGNRSDGWLEPLYYCCPDSPFELKAYVQQNASLATPYHDGTADDAHRRLAVSFLADQGLWEQAIVKFLDGDVNTQASSYDYLLRKLAEAGETRAARAVSQKFLQTILSSERADSFRDLIAVIQHYIGLLESEIRLDH